MDRFLAAMIVLTLMAGLGAADYWINLRGGSELEDLVSASLPPLPPQESLPEAAVAEPPPSVDFFPSPLQAQLLSTYFLQPPQRMRQLFEVFDLASLAGVEVSQLRLQPLSGIAQDSLVVYRIQDSSRSASLAYLNLKLALLSQLQDATLVNETGSAYGENSFFFNSPQASETAFLLAQSSDFLWGFQYSKSSALAFGAVQAILQSPSSASQPPSA